MKSICHLECCPARIAAYSGPHRGARRYRPGLAGKHLHLGARGPREPALVGTQCPTAEIELCAASSVFGVYTCVRACGSVAYAHLSVPLRHCSSLEISMLRHVQGRPRGLDVPGPAPREPAGLHGRHGAAGGLPRRAGRGVAPPRAGAHRRHGTNSSDEECAESCYPGTKSADTPCALSSSLALCMVASRPRGHLRTAESRAGPPPRTAHGHRGRRGGHGGGAARPDVLRTPPPTH